jgi:hypothetical protein
MFCRFERAKHQRNANKVISDFHRRMLVIADTIKQILIVTEGEFFRNCLEIPASLKLMQSKSFEFYAGFELAVFERSSG